MTNTNLVQYTIGDVIDVIERKETEKFINIVMRNVMKEHDIVEYGKENKHIIINWRMIVLFVMILAKLVSIIR